MKLPRKFFFNLWYLFKPPWDTNVTPPELIDFIENHSPGRALDLGCGTGTNVITLAQHGWDAMGVDFAGKAIRTARRKAKRAQVEAKFILRDITKLDDMPRPFDLILDIGCFHSLDDQMQTEYLNNLERLLKPGGAFLLYVFFRTDPHASGSGISENELDSISDHLDLVSRQDGTDREVRPSAWLLYRMPA
jgi:SAM-dependent methyltransferase